jgi:uncharacterized lipoprotein YehR (DUF1307 family)
MRGNILKLTFFGLLSISLLGCGSKEETTNSTGKLKGVCKEAYDAHLEFYDNNQQAQKIMQKNGISRENFEKDIRERYTDADEKYCQAELNNVKNEYPENEEDNE